MHDGVGRDGSPKSVALGEVALASVGRLQSCPEDVLFWLVPPGVDLYQDPKTTLSFVQRWRRLQDNSWTTSELVVSLTLGHRSHSTSEPSPWTPALEPAANEALGLTLRLSEKLGDLDRLWKPLLEQGIVRAQDAADICGQLYDSTTAQKVAAFLEGEFQLNYLGMRFELTFFFAGSRGTTIAAPTSSDKGKAILSLKNLPPNMQISLTPLRNDSIAAVTLTGVLSSTNTGTATFSIPSILFDLDFPGHFMRRLRSVAVSIPCILGPYATLTATLSLTQHSYRVSSAPSTADAYLTAGVADGGFRTDVVPIAAVATSSGVQDTGSFDLTFGAAAGAHSNDGCYGPFEGAGAVSSWRLELPPFSGRPFDYGTISDVVLHVRYTAVDGGPLLRRAASAAVTTLRTRAEGLGARDRF